MTKRLILSSTTLATLAFVVQGALAEGAASTAPHRTPSASSASTGQTGGSNWSAKKREAPYRAAAFEINLMHQTQVTLAQAIASAEHDARGKALDAFLDDNGGKPAYRVRVLQNNNAIATDWIDADSGKMTKQGPVLPKSQWTAVDRLEIANREHSNIGLANAIAVAQKHDPGLAVNADASDVRGRLAYDVDLVFKGKVESLMVQPSPAQTMAHGNKANIQS